VYLVHSTANCTADKPGEHKFSSYKGCAPLPTSRLQVRGDPTSVGPTGEQNTYQKTSQNPPLAPPASP